jgi:DNA-directed RNA polymerase subunit F
MTKTKHLIVTLLLLMITSLLAGCFYQNSSQTVTSAKTLETSATTAAEVIKGHLEIVTQGRTYVPIEHWVYSYQDGVSADGKWFDKLALDMDPDLKANLNAAEAIPYSEDFTFFKVWSGGSEKVEEVSFKVFDEQMEPILEQKGELKFSSQDGLYYIAVFMRWGNEKRYSGYQYIFKVIKSTQFISGDPVTDLLQINPTLIQDLKIIRVKDGEIIDSLANPEHLNRIMERLGKLLLEDDSGSTGLELEGYRLEFIINYTWGNQYVICQFDSGMQISPTDELVYACLGDGHYYALSDHGNGKLNEYFEQRQYQTVTSGSD